MRGDGLDFLWLELTNRCNLRCVHCYTDSHPGSGDRDRLTTGDYESLLRQAYALGCRKVQFIGGEPQLHPDFRRLLGAARELGFTFVEVFSNLTHLREETLRYAVEAGVQFATSVYSDDPAIHDAVTRVRSSHARTIGNLGRLVEHGVVTRAAVIRIDPTPGAAERTTSYLHGLGVPAVRAGDVRGFGRGQDLLGEPGGLDGLCGHCWSSRLCVAPDGTAYACVMARDWPVGNVLDTPLAQIVRGAALADVRRAVYRDVWAPRAAAGRVPDPHGDPRPDDADPEPDDAGGAPERAADGGGGGSRCAPADRERGCGPDELPGCEPEDLTRCEPLEPCEPEEQPAGDGVQGCDVVWFCGPGPCGPELPCPQSCMPDAPACPQTAKPCPQSPA